MGALLPVSFKEINAHEGLDCAYNTTEVRKASRRTKHRSTNVFAFLA